MTFSGFSDPDNHQNTPIEFLPCQFQSNIDSTNKPIYFDPIVKAETDSLKEVSLQGRKMLGKDWQVPDGYRGYVMGKKQGVYGDRVDMEVVGEFAQVREWKKDQWTDEGGIG